MHKSPSQPRSIPYVEGGKGSRGMSAGVAGTGAPVRTHSDMERNIMAMLNVQPPTDRVSQQTIAAPSVPPSKAPVAPAPAVQAQRAVRSRAQPPKSPSRGARRAAAAAACAGEQTPVRTEPPVKDATSDNNFFSQSLDGKANNLPSPVSPGANSGLWSADGRGSPGGRDDHDGGSGDDDDDKAAPEWWDCPADGSDDGDSGDGAMSPHRAGGLGMPPRAVDSGFSSTGLPSSWERGSLGNFLGGSGGGGGGEHSPLDLLPTPTPWAYSAGSARDVLGVPGVGMDLNGSTGSGSLTAGLDDMRDVNDWPLAAAAGLAADAKPFEPVTLGMPPAVTNTTAAPGPKARLPSPSSMLDGGANATSKFSSIGSPFAVSPLATDSSRSSIGNSEVWSMFGGGGSGLGSGLGGSGLGSSDLGGFELGSDSGSSGGAFNDKWRSKLHGLYASPSPPPSSNPLSTASAMSPEAASPLSQHLHSGDSVPPSPEHYSPLFARALATPDPTPSLSTTAQTVPASTAGPEFPAPAMAATSDSHLQASFGPFVGGAALPIGQQAAQPTVPSSASAVTSSPVASPAPTTLHVKGASRAALKCDDAQKPTKVAVPSPPPSQKQVTQATSKNQETSGPVNGKKAQGKGGAIGAATTATTAVSPKEAVLKETRKQPEKAKQVSVDTRMEEKPSIKVEKKIKQDYAQTKSLTTTGTIQVCVGN